MYAQKANRVVPIMEQDIEYYTNNGYRIIDKAGKVLYWAIDDKISRTEYEKLLLCYRKLAKEFLDAWTVDDMGDVSQLGLDTYCPDLLPAELDM